MTTSDPVRELPFNKRYIALAFAALFVLYYMSGSNSANGAGALRAQCETCPPCEANRPVADSSHKPVAEASHPAVAAASSSPTPSRTAAPSNAPLDPLLPVPGAGVVAATRWEGGYLPTVTHDVVPGRRFPSVHSLDGLGDWTQPPVTLQGQVTLQTTFGQALHRMASRPDVHLILESGTWFGGGSTWCMGQAMRSKVRDASRPDQWIMTLEIYGPAHDYASQTLSRLPVTCLKGGSVGMEGYLSPADMEPSEVSGDHFKLYYERDKQLAATSPRLLPALCSAYDFDFVLLDGNEYTGWAEFEVVNSLCLPKYLALHDCGTLKTRKVQAYIDQHPNDWKLIEKGADAAQWAIYENLHPR